MRDRLEACRVLVVVAGMEGALPSVVAGLVSVPVIAVPTSVGYGASFGGLAALLGMLNSCGSGVTVVNIDNGFGAAYAAATINRLPPNRPRRARFRRLRPPDFQRPRLATPADGIQTERETDRPFSPMPDETSAARPILPVSRRAFLAHAGRGLVAATLGRRNPARRRPRRGEPAQAASSCRNIHAKTEQDAGPLPEPLPPGERVGFAVVGLGHLALKQIIPAFGA